MVLSPIDSLEVILLTDNYTDRLLPTLYPASRPPLIRDGYFLPLPPPIAEHGFSSLIRATCNVKENQMNDVGIQRENIVLFDCGTSDKARTFLEK